MIRRILCWLGWHKWYCPHLCCDKDFDRKCRVKIGVYCKYCGKVKR